MKRIFLLATAMLLVLAACSKVSPAGDADEQREIGFRAARYVTKADFTNESFGTYAWFTADYGSENEPFMVNERVGLVGGKWMPVNSRYWPKSGYIDFISYSPYGEGNPTITQSKKYIVNQYGDDELVTEGANITWNDYAVKPDNVDLMYADRNYYCTEYWYAKDGVPIYFRHALAQVGFQAQLDFEDDRDQYGGTLWDVTILEASVSGIATTGSLSLDIDPDIRENEWILPETVIPEKKDIVHVWTLPAEYETKDVVLIAPATEEENEAEEESEVIGLQLSAYRPLSLYDWESEDYDQIKYFYVLPQVLEPETHFLHLKFKIRTTLPNQHTIEEMVTRDIDLSTFTDQPAWQINQRILYTIMIRPLSDEPENARIVFDPVISDWDVVQGGIEIQL